MSMDTDGLFIIRNEAALSSPYVVFIENTPHQLRSSCISTAERYDRLYSALLRVRCSKHENHRYTRLSAEKASKVTQ